MNVPRIRKRYKSGTRQHRVRGEQNPSLYVISLKSAFCSENKTTGAKASRLARMALAGFPVPEAYVVTNEALKRFCTHNNISLQSLLHVDENSTDQISDRNNMGDRIRNGEMPQEIRQAVDDALKGLGAPSYAVRSSSAAEDGQVFSMAGQFQTCLQVTESDVCDSIKTCWASMFNASVAAYSAKNNFAAGKNMGVIIQTQINALYSGVLFSLDPLRKTADFMTIEWVQGLGEKLVSGEVTPERLMVHKSSLAVPQSIKPPLREALQRLCTLARQAEQMFGQPVDIEWCCDDAGLHVLQARPVTGLEREDCVIWSNVNMNENFPHPLTPLAWSVAEKFYTNYIRCALRLFGWNDAKMAQAQTILTNLTGIQGGRIYYNLNNWYEMLHFFPIGTRLVRLLDHYIGQNTPFNFQPQAGNRWAHRRRHYFSTILFWLRLCRIVASARLRLDQFETTFYAQRRQWRGVAYTDLNADKLYELLTSLQSFVATHWSPPVIADILVMIFPGALKFLSASWTEGDTETTCVRLLQGIRVASTEPAAIIATMAEKIKNDATADEILLSGDYDRLGSVLNDELKALLHDFMERFGGRCYHDCMLVFPTFEERHALFWDLVQRSRRAQTRQTAEAETNIRAYKTSLRAVLRGLPWRRKPIYGFVVRQARRSISLRERGRLLQSLLFGEMRAVSLELGQRLSASGFIAQKEDIFHLSLDEIEKLVYGKYLFPENLEGVIENRKAAHSDFSQYTPPETFYLKKGEYFKPQPHACAVSEAGSVLQGTGISEGVVEGKARVITDPAQGHDLRQGDILVARATDPGWTPLFLTAGGLILEKGGMLSHGAIVAREFGIPAVVGVNGATTQIADGRPVYLDGGNGIVRLL